MYGKCFILLVPGGGRLKTSNVGTVSKFCLCVAADDLIILSLFQEDVLLFFGSLSSECDLVTV